MATNVVLAGMGADHVNDPAVSPAAVPSDGQRHRDRRQRLLHLGQRRQSGVVRQHQRRPGDGFTPGTGAANPLDGVLAARRARRPLPTWMATATWTRWWAQPTARCGTSRTPARRSRRSTSIATANPFDGIDVGSQSAPAFADLDGDGDLDLVVGAGDGTLSNFENTGTASAPVYVAQTGAANPFDGVDVGTQARRPWPTWMATAIWTWWWARATARCATSRTPARPRRRPMWSRRAWPIRSTASTSARRARRPRRPGWRRRPGRAGGRWRRHAALLREHRHGRGRRPMWSAPARPIRSTASTSGTLSAPVLRRPGWRRRPGYGAGRERRHVRVLREHRHQRRRRRRDLRGRRRQRGGGRGRCRQHRCGHGQ